MASATRPRVASTATSRCETSLRKDSGDRDSPADRVGAVSDGTAPAAGRSGTHDGPPFERVLIANRGEIAVRIMRTCRDLGIATVAVHSDADAEAMHVRLADRAVRIGPAAATESYLRSEAIIEAALATAAAAVHPGYGFLSERAPFAAAVEAAGLVFVGPAPATLAALGDKLEARAAARAAGVPIVPGTFEPLPLGDAARIVAAAEAVGYPLLIKAAAGGGGRGMRRVDDPADLAAAATAAAGEARAAFGDGAVYLERLVEGGRHIEVQLLGDSRGTVVALGERDCSTQRRHQKLVEEAPAPGLTPEQRAHVHALAVTVARSVGLRNAATAEFLFAPDGSFYFLEVNARLQVEHGVTELVTGLDLVAEQLVLAAGAPLSPAVLAAAANASRPDRHAIELRVSAEDPSLDFAPMPGRVTRWREPGGPGVRIDSATEAGSMVSGDYDPLLAKVLVVAPERSTALARARRAVREFETGGLQTTLPFHAWLLDHPGFVAGRPSIELVASDWDAAPLRALAAERAADVVARLVLEGAGAAADRSLTTGPNGLATSGATTRTPSDDRGGNWKQEPWA
jgi:acetyl-CoA carboxylase biotin carboxylase subunit